MPDPTPLPVPLLVIGWGNTLRGDDAAGPRFADAVEALALPGVRVLCLPQLAPDLAEDVARADRVLFADACEPGRGGLRPLGAEHAETAAASVVSHHATPQELVELARALYGRVPEAWLLGFEARTFDYGAAMSPEVAVAVDRAVREFPAFASREAVPRIAHA